MLEKSVSLADGLPNLDRSAIGRVLKSGAEDVLDAQRNQPPLLRVRLPAAEEPDDAAKGSVASRKTVERPALTAVRGGHDKGLTTALYGRSLVVLKSRSWPCRIGRRVGRAPRERTPRYPAKCGAG